jgi:hypothetical protein
VKPSKPVLWIAVLSVGLAYLGWWLLSERRFAESTDLWKPLSPGVALAGALLWIWDRWLWRLPVLSKLANRPDINGTWHGEMVSSYDPDDTGEPYRDDRVFLVIKQSYWNLSASFWTRRSDSVSRLSQFTAMPDGRQMLTYVYTNKPGQLDRLINPEHGGTTLIPVAPGKPGKLSGNYYTERHTSGQLIFGAKHKSTAVARWEDAAALFGLDDAAHI